MAGRPRTFDRDDALAAAVEQFWRTGFEGTSLATLTDAMGISPPSLYAAFGDKQRLFDEASAAYFARTCEGLDSALALPTVREAITRMLTDTAHAHTDVATPPGCLALTEPRLEAQRDVIRDKVRDRLDHAVRDGDVPASTDTMQLASFLVAVLRGMSGRARDGGDLDELLGIAEVAIQALPEPVSGARGSASRGRRTRPTTARRSPGRGPTA